MANPQRSEPGEPFMREAAAADFLDLSTRKLQHLRQQGAIPFYTLPGVRGVRYRRADLERWANTRAPATPTAAVTEPPPDEAA